VLQSADPRTFVITPDRDFERVLADPKVWGVRYLLVPSGQGYSGFDAVGRAYPGMFDTGSRIAHLVKQFGDGIFAWRLYAVN
jgi:hypothetical protein